MPYVSIPAGRAHDRTKSSDWWDGGPLLPAIHAADAQPTDTGLLDLAGNKIMRVAPPVGFGRDREW